MSKADGFMGASKIPLRFATSAFIYGEICTDGCTFLEDNTDPVLKKEKTKL